MIPSLGAEDLVCYGEPFCGAEDGSYNAYERLLYPSADEALMAHVCFQYGSLALAEWPHYVDEETVRLQWLHVSNENPDELWVFCDPESPGAVEAWLVSAPGAPL